MSGLGLVLGLGLGLGLVLGLGLGLGLANPYLHSVESRVMTMMMRNSE